MGLLDLGLEPVLHALPLCVALAVRTGRTGVVPFRYAALMQHLLELRHHLLFLVLHRRLLVDAPHHFPLGWLGWSGLQLLMSGFALRL